MTPEVDAFMLDEAVARLRAGRLVAFPTETVYGLGADARNADAIAAIYRAKGRPSDHPVIVHLAEGADVHAWAEQVPALATRLIERFWPGPLTLILRRAAGVPAAVAGGQDSVGLRCPAHPVAQALLAAFASRAPDAGIAAPSANKFGRVSPTSAAHVRGEFPGEDVYVLDGGDCPVGIESTILDLSRAAPVLLRPGSITAAMLAEVIGALPALPDASAPRASGTLAAHYAPRTPLALVDADALPDADPGAAVWTYSQPLRGPLWRRAPSDAAGYARALYATVRALDSLGASRILIERPPGGAEWAAIHDRLGRAAVGSGVAQA